jgi:peptidoglycan/xylan/chitin deacetylase (PgdA/CDA1 family)
MPTRFCKKIAASIFIFSCVLSCALPISASSMPKRTNSEPDGIVVPIIMYHGVKTSNTQKDVITPNELETDLRYLQSNHYSTITMTDLIGYANCEKELPEKPIILSFDDGYYNNYAYVLPLLEKYRMKIVFSLIGIYTDDATDQPQNNLNYSHVTWAQANAMIQSGLVEIQNHTYNLHTITAKRSGCKKNPGESQAHYEKVLTEDIGRLQQEITSMTGTTPNTFTYPYGLISKESCPIIKSLGFKASLTCDCGINIVPKNPDALFGLKRICRPHGLSLQTELQKAMKELKLPHASSQCVSQRS